MTNVEFGMSHGYTLALQRVQTELAYLQDDLKHHHRKLSAKELQAFIQCMIENRAELRENPFAFVRCNNVVPGGFEVWHEDEHRRRMYSHDSP